MRWAIWGTNAISARFVAGLADAINQPADWRVTYAPGFLDRLLGPRLDALHQH